MAATYTFDATLSTQKDEARQRVGDTDAMPKWFASDQAIVLWIANFGYDEACAVYAESIGAQWSQLAVNVTQSKLRLQYQQNSRVFMDLAGNIRRYAQPDPGDPIQTGAAPGAMQAPDLRNSLIALPPCDPNNPYLLPGPVL